MNRSVLYIIDTLQTGGAEKSLLEITRNFKKYKPVFVLLFNKKSDLKTEFDQTGIQVIDLNLTGTFHFKKLAREASSVLVELHPVLVHSTLFKSDMVSRELVKYIPVPLINSLVNNSYSKQRYQSEPLSIKIKLWLLQQWDAFTARKVTMFLSNSEAIKGTNARALRLPLDKIRVIYRGRSLEPFEEITEQHIEVFRKDGNLTEKKVFLNVSRLIDRKGQLELIRAFGLLCQQRKDCVLLIAGEGPFRKALEEEVSVLSLEDNIKLLGNRNDVPLLLKSADYFVFPSHYEGLPGALIEAMFARLPIIASSIPENKECVDESMALFYEAGNVKELTSKMLMALDDKQWKERTDSTFGYAMEHFEISKVAAQYEALYDELLSK